MKRGIFIALMTLFAVAILNTLLSDFANAQDKGWGHLTGRIVVSGTVPDPEPLDLESGDRDYCVATGKSFVDQSLLVSDGGGLQNACVMMYFGRGDDVRPEVHPSFAEAAGKAVEINNKDCLFEPRAVFVRTGQVLTLKNSDAIGHNCHIVTMGNEENVSLGAGQSADIRMETSDKVPGIVKCDIHPWMAAVILVRDEPYACFTDAEGRFRIENIPAGKWTFQFWHQRSGNLKDLSREGAAVAGRRGELEVTIEDGKTTDLGELKIDIASLLKDN